MANDVKKAPEKKESAPKSPVAAATGPSHCKSESCKKAPDKFGFCMDHYEWYMAGVIRGDGKKPIDFEQKFRQFQQKHKKVA